MGIEKAATWLLFLCLKQGVLLPQEQILEEMVDSLYQCGLGTRKRTPDWMGCGRRVRTDVMMARFGDVGSVLASLDERLASGRWQYAWLRGTCIYRGAFIRQNLACFKIKFLKRRGGAVKGWLESGDGGFLRHRGSGERLSRIFLHCFAYGKKAALCARLECRFTAWPEPSFCEPGVVEIILDAGPAAGTADVSLFFLNLAVKEL